MAMTANFGFTTTATKMGSFFAMKLSA